jgi:YHS domain-containing protein
MDERVSTMYKGQVFEFCCKPCLKKFNKDPEKYRAMLRPR